MSMLSLHIESTGSMVMFPRFTLRRPNRVWRPAWGNTKIPELWERDDREVRRIQRRTTTPSSGRRHRCWTGPETRVKGGPAHTDDTCRGVLELGQRTSWKSWVAGSHWWGDVKGGAIITFDLQWHIYLVGYGYKVVEVSLFFTFAQIKTEAFSQSKVLLISKFVSLEQLFHCQISYQ